MVSASASRTDAYEYTCNFQVYLSFATPLSGIVFNPSHQTTYLSLSSLFFFTAKSPNQVVESSPPPFPVPYSRSPKNDVAGTPSGTNMAGGWGFIPFSSYQMIFFFPLPYLGSVRCRPSNPHCA
ncbi:hypothetical protein J3F83DRAFT_29361 [Trichoderma novae-zelandiae]